MQAAQTAARGISSLQKVKTKFKALISHGMRTASVILLDQIPVLGINRPTIEEEIPPKHEAKRFVDPFTSHAYKRTTASF
jgi:hypothetical protein